jgi:hypothetical protein
VARATSPSRWAYVVVTGAVTCAGEEHGPGAVVLPDADVVAVGDVEVLAFPRSEEPALHQRFPGLAVPPRRARPHCPANWVRSVVVGATSA